MPNVAGVQFPYTPEGQQAAQLYERSLSPSRGLGFRPITMQQGGDAEARAIVQGLYALMSDGTNEQVEAYVNKNRKDLIEIAKIDDRMFDMLRRVLYGDEAIRERTDIQTQLDKNAQGMEEIETQMSRIEGLRNQTEELLGDLGRIGADRELAGNLGRIEDSVAASPGYNTGDYFPPERPLDQREALRATGDTRLSDQDIAAAEALGFERYYGAEEARNQAGTGLPPYLGTITPVPRNFEREPYEGPDSDLYPPTPPITPPMFPATGKNFHPSYTGPSRFGAGGYASRGTVAGELEPRGYLTARQAGETMRERAKGLRGQRNYGGGIGSLYNRHG